jgi:hypothetical protein
MNVEHHWSTLEAWTVEKLAEALSEINERTEATAFFPGGATYRTQFFGTQIGRMRDKSYQTQKTGSPLVE